MVIVGPSQMEDRMIARLKSGALFLAMGTVSLIVGLAAAPYLYTLGATIEANVIGIGGMLLASLGISIAILEVAVGRD